MSFHYSNIFELLLWHIKEKSRYMDFSRTSQGKFLTQKTWNQINFQLNESNQNFVCFLKIV